MFKHPSKVCMTYFEHMKFSLNLSRLLMYGSYYAFIHAFIPDIHVKTTSNTVVEIQKLIDSAGCRKED
tara:strand:- start:6223 stop:6426 length:204 start_codon:yes stop_codon:yes gene_type:complete